MYDMMVIWSRTKGANYIKHTYTAFSHLILNFVKNESWNEEEQVTTNVSFILVCLVLPWNYAHVCFSYANSLAKSWLMVRAIL